MLNRKYILALILAVLLATVTLMFLFRDPPRKFDWRETYDEASRQPYGAYVIFELLQGLFPGHPLEVLRDSLHGVLPEEDESANYIFLGQALYMDSSDVNALLRFVESGNLAFISSKTIPYDLMFHLYYEECDDIYWEDYNILYDTAVALNFEHAELRPEEPYRYEYVARQKAQPYSWSYIESFYFCGQEEGLVPIGMMNDSLANFARVRYGDGFFYLHTTPLAFSNIQLLEEWGLEYANRAFSHLRAGPIYWDRYSRAPEWMGRRMNNRGNALSNRQLSDESPLQYILSQPPLAWAWYTLLGLGLLFLAFRAKRKQRIIPVLEPNTNTSLAFLSTIGRLYFIQNNHKKLALLQMKLFRAFLWEHYAIQSRDLDEGLVERLAHKSEISKETIRKILLLYKNIRNSSFVSENTLIDFHRLLDGFYKNCK
ncbi:MAG: DUF4350 domain-containing protein [Phaeodactylibacter sp.]|nr:DUF4350 domain-containing protein [Phaeodactylibacter sp.]